MLLRKFLTELGVRYRIRNTLPGRPDIVVKRARLAIFVDGCFWHSCPMHGVRPRSRQEFWRTKLKANKARDAAVTKKLQDQEWHVIRIWEHDLQPKAGLSVTQARRLVGILRKSGVQPKVKN